MQLPMAVNMSGHSIDVKRTSRQRVRGLNLARKACGISVTLIRGLDARRMQASGHAFKFANIRHKNIDCAVDVPSEDRTITM